MVKRGLIKSGVGALLGLALGAQAAAAPQATSPDPSWAGVREIVVVSQFTQSGVLIRELSAESLCKRVQAIAAVGAPVPVVCAQLGDPKLRASGTALLLFQAAVSDVVAGQRLLIFNIRRADEHGLEPAPRHFGSTPRAVALTAALDEARLDSAIRASLAELLPWLRDSRTNQDQIQTGEK